VPSQHEHGFPALLVQLLEEEKRLLFQPETAFLVAVHDVESVLSPVIRDIIPFERLYGGDAVSFALM